MLILINVSRFENSNIWYINAINLEIIRDIKDPETPGTLDELGIVTEDSVIIESTKIYL